MTDRDPKDILTLHEYQPVYFPKEDMPEELGATLWQQYGTQIAVDFPTPKTGHQWRLTAQGWIGLIPLSREFSILLQPKVALDNLFRMLEYAYRLKSFYFLEGLVDCQSLTEFYERLANVLAKRVLDRCRKGYYRTYLLETERLPFIRGRMDMLQALRTPWNVRRQCHYEEHTPDIAENQILA